MSSEIYAALVTGMFLLAAGAAARQAYLNKRLGDKAGAEGAAIGAKTPAEVESISVTTMRAALEAESRRADAAIERERATRAELDEERRGRRQDREEHRAEMAVLEERLQIMQRQLTEMQAELAQRMARLTDDDN